MVRREIITDPNELVGRVEADRIASVSERGGGSTVVLDAIKDLDTDYVEYPSLGERSIADNNNLAINSILGSVKKLQAFGTFGDSPLNIADYTGVSLDVDSLFESMNNQITNITGTGDLLSVMKLSDALDGIGIGGVDFLKDNYPSIISDVLLNMDISKLYPNISEEQLKALGLLMISAVTILCPEWYWLDKEREVYNYKLLSALSPGVCDLLRLYGDYAEVLDLSEGLYGYRTKA